MRDKIISIGFSCIFIFVGVISLILKDNDISFLERRKLVTKDDLSSSFLEKIEDYLNDQFPMRNQVLSINSFYERNILGNKEKNNVYLVDDIIYEKNYPLNDKSVNSFVNKMNYIQDTYFKNQHVYYTIVPDKSFFLEDNKYLKMDYDKMFDVLNKMNSDYIDIISALRIDDYYQTDIHIKQESWLNVIPYLNRKMNFGYKMINYQHKNYYPFYGASYSKVLDIKHADELNYLVNDSQKDFVVNHLEFGNKKLYDLDKLGSIDSYDVFLSGPSAFIEITNPNNESGRELIVFRDSFGSSLVPLLTPYYSKIVVIDLRYMDSSMLENYIDSKPVNQDVLFLYSTLIVNNSSILKVNVNL